MIFSSKESKSEKKLFSFGGGEGKEGLASVNEFFTKNPNQKKKKFSFFFFCGGGGGVERGG